MPLWSLFETHLLFSPSSFRLWQNTIYSCPLRIMLRLPGLCPGCSCIRWAFHPLLDLANSIQASLVTPLLSRVKVNTPACPCPSLSVGFSLSGLFTRDSISLDCHPEQWQGSVSQALAWCLALSRWAWRALWDGLSLLPWKTVWFGRYRSMVDKAAGAGTHSHAGNPVHLGLGGSGFS
jgi:hypothetical protein